MDYLTFKPIYQERVWGGRAFAEKLGRVLPEGNPVGESWEIVDRPEANSVVADGPFAGWTLGRLRAERASGLMGPNWDPARPFPILVKWLDCAERLSLQVHPPAAVAPTLGGEPKTENWYIAATSGDAAVLAGLRRGVTRAEFEAALREERLEPLVCRLPCQPGDSLFVRSGRLHAIDAGNLILEIQENSDTTYRVYDWGRVGLDGKPRTLHLEESLASIDFEDFEPTLIHPEGRGQILAESREFTLRRLSLDTGERLVFRANEEPRILSVVDGSLETPHGVTIGAGMNALLPYVGEGSFTAREATTVLVTTGFA